MQTEFIASKNNAYYYPIYEQEDNEGISIKDEEIDNLRDNLYACVMEIEDKEKEIANLEVSIKLFERLLKEFKKKVIKHIVSTILELGVVFLLVDAAGIVFEPKERMFIGVGMFILFLGISRAVYMCIYHSRTGVVRIKFITKLESYSNSIEECKIQIEDNKSDIVELNKKISRFREQIASLEL